MMVAPNILYVHSHDTGRWVQPYGHQVPTPNIQHLADQGVLFRNAFSAAPVCSGSRAALLTGQHCHSNGMLGLAHRGWSLHDYGTLWVHALRPAGYRSTLIGEQHLSVDPGVLGYDEVVDVPSNRASEVTPAPYKSFLEEHRPGLRFHHRAIEHLLHQILVQEAFWDSFFEHTGTKPILVLYENFAGDHTTSTVRLLDRLGLEVPDPSVLRPPLRRQSDSVNDVWVRRYSDLKLGTEFDLVPAGAPTP